MNKETLSKIFLFMAGATIGSAVTWKLVKTKYEQIANEEIESVKEYYKNKYEKTEKESESQSVQELDPEVTEEEIKEYADFVEDSGYMTMDNEIVSNMACDVPYPISIEDFGLFEDYEQVYLTYHSDGYISDNDDEEVDDVDDILGYRNLSPFNDGNCETIYIRNDSTKTDYEISYTSESYEEM